MTRAALMTGISGFIGARLALRLLSEGWRVHAIVRPESDVAEFSDRADLRLHVHDGTAQGMTAIFADARPDVVFHLASRFLADHDMKQLDDLIRSNVLFPAQLMEAMANADVRYLVTAGTAWQHFEGEDYRPVNLYAATKQAADDLLAYYSDARNLSAITLKLFDTYGKGDKRRKLLRIIGDAVRSGDTLDMSPGEQIVDLTHVDDVVSAFTVANDHLRSSSTRRNEHFFVSGERYSIRALVDQVQRSTSRPLRVNFGGRRYRDREVMVPVVPTAAQRLPGWTPAHGLKEWLPSLLDE